MKNILITGVPGSGKSTICSLLKNQGFNAIDGLSRNGLMHWVNKTTQSFDQYKPDAGFEWLMNHIWKWDEEKLEELINKNSSSPIFICGVAPMERDILSYFDHIFLLQISKETMEKRLKERPGDYAFGKAIGEIEYILSWKEIFEKYFMDHGVEVIDETLPPERVLKRVLFLGGK